MREFTGSNRLALTAEEVARKLYEDELLAWDAAGCPGKPPRPITRERVNQIINAALKKLRADFEAKGYADYFEEMSVKGWIWPEGGE